MIDQLRTERLILRPLDEGDVEFLFARFATWEVVRFLSAPPWPYSREDARQFIDRERHLSATDRTLVITLAGVPIGGIAMPNRAASRSQRAGGPHLSYWLGRAHWGRGYVTEAARGLIAHAFDTLGFDTIYSGVFADNQQSLRVQHRLGFVRDNETMLRSRPRGGDFPHINTSLARDSYRVP